MRLYIQKEMGGKRNNLNLVYLERLQDTKKQKESICNKIFIEHIGLMDLGLLNHIRKQNGKLLK